MPVTEAKYASVINNVVEENPRRESYPPKSPHRGDDFASGQKEGEEELVKPDDLDSLMGNLRARIAAKGFLNSLRAPP